MDSEDIPTHIGFILDGNRRWAKQHGLSSLEGHQKGLEVFHDIVQAAFEHDVKYMSAYVFSQENWTRTEKEVGYLMKLVIKAAEKYLDEMHEAGIRIIFLGSSTNLSKDVLATAERVVRKTAENTRGTLVLCFNYSGQQEIADAVQSIVRQGVVAKDVTPELVERHLNHAEIPPVDLLIRTSGEQRLSGFMLWRAAYSELLFVDKFWPDYTKTDLTAALQEYAARHRRFGK